MFVLFVLLCDPGMRRYVFSSRLVACSCVCSVGIKIEMISLREEIHVVGRLNTRVTIRFG